VDASANVTREKVNPAAIGIGSELGNKTFPPFTLYQAQVSVSYTLDLFGANRRTLEGLAGIDYQQYELDAARLTHAGNVVTSVIRRASLAAQIGLSERPLAMQSQQLDIAEQRYRAGGISQSDLFSQRSQVEQTRASIAPSPVSWPRRGSPSSCSMRTLKAQHSTGHSGAVRTDCDGYSVRSGWLERRCIRKRRSSRAVQTRSSSMDHPGSRRLRAPPCWRPTWC
jgi:hypothetical protein